MICRRCLRTTARQKRQLRNSAPHSTPSSRTFSTVPPRRSTPFSASTSTQAPARPAPRVTNNAGPSAATSTSAAQPFSTPHTPSTAKEKKPAGPNSTASKFPPSSVRAGAVLRGLNVLKGKLDPVAMEDDQYPPWLWKLLVAQGGESAQGGAGGAGDGAGAGGEGDLYAKSANQRRKAAKALRKKEAALGGRLAEPPVPIDQQSVDLPGGDAMGAGGEDGVRENVGAAGVRQSVTKAMRVRRRASIKEANFLKGVS